MPFIERLRSEGRITPEQAAVLESVETGRVFSLSAELRALLYLGALFLIAGVSATVRKYFDRLGPFAILSALTGACAACFTYVEAKRAPYSDGEVPSPTPAFDYVLFVGCALLGIEFSYLETQYHLLKDLWSYYFLASSLLFFAFSYRHDNRMVLGMAVLNLGTWLGMELKRWGVPFSHEVVALLFGAGVVSAGLASYSRGFKAHFLDTYLNIGLNVMFVILTLKTVMHGGASPWTLGLAALTAASAGAAVERRKLLYFFYACLYGYIGFSSCVYRALSLGPTGGALYLLFSGIFMAWALFSFRRSLRQDP